MRIPTDSSSQSQLHAASLALFVLVLLSFFVTGACGLLYQVVWARKLVLLFGTTAYAISTVLAIFFLGLGLGSLWGGRLAEQTSRPLRLYGFFQIAIGLWAVFFILAVGVGEEAVVSLLRPVASIRPLAVLLRVILALVFLIVPVTLMGATLPLLVRFVAWERRVAGVRIGALYTVNTFGAVVGCALTGFYLIAQFGYTRTTFIGAAASVAVGGLCILLSRTIGEDMAARDGALPDRVVVPLPETPPPPAVMALVITTFAVSGFCGLAIEVLWTRLLTIIFTGTTYAYTTMLTALLCGIAVGSAVGSLISDRTRRHVLFFGLTEALAGVACIATVLAFARVPDLYGHLSREAGLRWDGLLRAKFIVSFFVVLAPTFFFGMDFPFAVKAAAGFQQRFGRDVGVLYGANTIGGVLGAIAGGFLIIPLLGAHLGMIAIGLSLAILGIITAYAGSKGSNVAIAGVTAVLLVGAGTTWAATQGNVGLALTLARMPEDNILVHFDEGVEGTVAVSDEIDDSPHSDRVLWINGVQATASIERGVKMNRFQGVLPLLFDRDLDDALLMCFGSGITCGTLALYDFDRIDAVEISPEVYKAARLFHEDNLGVMDAPNVDFIVDDGRNFLLTTRNTYDLITFEPMPLALAGVSTFYTQEYYELCRRRLNPGGIVSQWVPLHSLNPEVVRSLVYTFTTVFPYYTAWFVNADLFLIGSEEPLEIDYQRAAERINQPHIQDALVDVGLDDMPELLTSFLLDQENVDAFAAGGRIMVDDRPWAEFEAPKLIYERRVPDSLRILRQLHQSPLPLVRFKDMTAGERDAAVVAVERRFAAKRRNLEALTAYYTGAFGTEAEEGFIDALRIDPGDRSALYYLREIVRVRMEQYLGWQDYDKAQELLRNAAAVAPDEPFFQLKLGDLRYEQERFGAAREHYEQYVALGGTNPRAQERIDALR